MTLREIADRAAARLELGAHPDRAQLDAEALLLHRLGRDRAWLLAHWSDHPPLESAASFEALVERRFKGEPMQYIIGDAEFFGLTFHVESGVLIPRPETEHLIEEVLRLAAEFSKNCLEIADIGTGSGIIAVTLAHSLPHAHLAATDLSSQALAIAGQNAERNQVAARIDFRQGDLFAPLAGKRFHIVASNPPYVPLSDLDSLSVEVCDFEPHSALFAGDDGLEVYRRLIPDARPHLIVGGWLVLEIGYRQRSAIESLLSEAGYSDIRFLADYQGISRVAVARNG